MNDSTNRRRSETAEPNSSTTLHHRSCCCALCGTRYHNIAFKGTYVCESCVGYIKGLI